MNQAMRNLVLESFKQEFLLLVREERFEEADKLYQKYKKLKEVKDAQPPSQMAEVQTGAK